MAMNKMMLMMGLLFSLSVVSAFGVSTPYWDENPLNLAPGESMDVELVLQNMAGAENDVTFRAEMTDDGDGVASLIDSNLDYFIPFGSDDVVLRVRVDVPSDVDRGGVRDVVISFTQVSAEDAGMVSVSGGFTTKFPVFIVAPEKSVLSQSVPELEAPLKSPSTTWIWVLITVFVLTVLWFVWKKRKR